MWETLAKGGVVMIPLAVCSVLGLAIVLERAVSLRAALVLKKPILDLIDSATFPDDIALARALCDRNPCALATVVRVRLRNAHLCLNDATERFLGRFFACMAESDTDYLACLDLLLPLLESAGQTDDFFEVLVAHKRLLYRHLQHARRFETLLRQSNMETLMLQGVRAPHASQADLLVQMRYIDLICRAIFGRIEAIAAPLEAPVRHVSDATSPEAAVQALLRDL